MRLLVLTMCICTVGCSQTRPRNIVAYGDSLTVGVPHFNGEQDTYPYMLGESLAAKVTNLGVSGQTTEDLSRGIQQFLFTLWVNGADNILVLWSGTNDCAIGVLDCPPLVVGNLEYIARVSKLAGWRVVVITMVSRGNYFVDNEHQDLFASNALKVNELLKSSKWFDAVADPAPLLTEPTDVSLFWDKCHLFPKGYRLVADSVAEAILGLNPSRLKGPLY